MEKKQLQRLIKSAYLRKKHDNASHPSHTRLPGLDSAGKRLHFNQQQVAPKQTTTKRVTTLASNSQ